MSDRRIVEAALMRVAAIRILSESYFNDKNILSSLMWECEAQVRMVRGSFAKAPKYVSPEFLAELDKDLYTHNRHYEHLIPRKVLNAKIFSMMDEGISTPEIVDFYLENFDETAIITNKQAGLLDRKQEGDICLYDKMPTGWEWGDDPLARAKAREIELIDISNNEELQAKIKKFYRGKRPRINPKV